MCDKIYCMKSLEVSPLDGSQASEKLKAVQLEMIQEERVRLTDRFGDSSGRVRALMNVFILSTAMSSRALHKDQE